MPKAFQAQASKPFNERQNALLEVLRRCVALHPSGGSMIA